MVVKEEDDAEGKGDSCDATDRCLYCRFVHIALVYPDRIAVVQASSKDLDQERSDRHHLSIPEEGLRSADVQAAMRHPPREDIEKTDRCSLLGFSEEHTPPAYLFERSDQLPLVMKPSNANIPLEQSQSRPTKQVLKLAYDSLSAASSAVNLEALCSTCHNSSAKQEKLTVSDHSLNAMAVKGESEPAEGSEDPEQRDGSHRYSFSGRMESGQMPCHQANDVARRRQVNEGVPVAFIPMEGAHSCAVMMPRKVDLLHGPPYHGDVAFPYSEILFFVDALVQNICHLWNSDTTARDVTFHLPSVTIKPAYAEQQEQRRVGVLMSPSVEYIVAILAVLASGALFVPIDPFWPRKRVMAIVADSNPCLILTTETLKSFFLDALSSNVSVLCFDTSLAAMKTSCYPARDRDTFDCFCYCHGLQSRSSCYLMYTSGSTGKPKGVLGTEEGLLHRLLWMEREYPFQGNDVSIFKTAISFIDHLTEFLGPLLGKSCLLVPPARDLFRNPLALTLFLEAYNVSRLTAVPSLMRALLPSLQTLEGHLAIRSLRVLVLSGEVLPTWLFMSIHELIPDASILNLYGSTEISGDCLFFDCDTLWKDGNQYLKSLSSVPIGKPLSGCFVSIASDGSEEPEEGELWVGGVLLASGYNQIGSTIEKFVNVANYNLGLSQRMFRTGDYVRRLVDGNFIYLGRKDRTVKINGQRLALQEVEMNLEKNPIVAHAAVAVQTGVNDEQNLLAFVVTRSLHESKEEHIGLLETCLRSWLLESLPLEMVPKWFSFLPALPVLDSGKVDYQTLSKVNLAKSYKYSEEESEVSSLTSYIKGVFEQVLMVNNISIYDDFFRLGGSSVSAAHVAHVLGIDMRLLYVHRSAVALEAFLRVQQKEIRRDASLNKLEDAHDKLEDTHDRRQLKHSKKDGSFGESQYKLQGTLLPTFQAQGDNRQSAQLKDGSFSGSQYKLQGTLLPTFQAQGYNHQSVQLSWPYVQGGVETAWLRCCRHVFLGKQPDKEKSCTPHVVPILSPALPSSSYSIVIVWQTLLKACVDASPVVVHSRNTWRLFIGSHAQLFTCIDAMSGKLIWETSVGGRIESTAAIAANSKQLIVGCYDGCIYFFNFETGALEWNFKTGGEVKCQPTADTQGLIWCGSHDHKLYVLSVAEQRCVWEYDCQASVFASPAVDYTRALMYIATTGGTVIALKCDGSCPIVVWTYSVSVPIFGSPVVDCSTGYVVCSMVDGCVLALTSSGTLVWKCSSLGPIFAGASVSSTLPTQVLICSRDGWVYSLNLIDGVCVWKHCVGEPITSAASVDEGVELVFRELIGSVFTNHSFRLVCVCGSSGQLHVLKVYSGSSMHQESALKGGVGRGELREEDGYLRQCDVICRVDGCEDTLKDIAKCDPTEEVGFMDKEIKICECIAGMKLPGDVFSSPIMLCGRIFLGCRDDNVYCLEVCGIY